MILSDTSVSSNVPILIAAYYTKVVTTRVDSFKSIEPTEELIFQIPTDSVGLLYC